MLDKILNVFNKGKIMDDVKVDQEVITEEVITEEVKQEEVVVKEVKKETKKQGVSWFMNTDAE